MKRVWGWFRARRWWTQILIAIPSVLLAIVTLYVATRAVQYARAGGDACVYIPDAANLVCGVRDLEGEWERVRESDAWKNLEKKALRDRAFRAEVNAMLQGAGLPTLDQLDDRRWVEQNPMFQESNLVRAAGRDVMAALRVGAELNQSRMVVATKVRFTDYLLLPFAGWALPKDGGFYKLRQGKKDWFIVIDDAYVVASDDRGLLADGLRKKGKRPAAARPLWIQAEFSNSPALARWRKKFNAFPAGLAFPYLNAETARALEIHASVTGAAVQIELRLDGAQVLPGASDPAMLALAPANASAVEMHPAGMAEVYEWLKSLTAPQPKASNFDKFVQKNATDAIKELEKAGFREKFLPRVSSPMVLMTGSEAGEKDRTYTAVAFVMRSSDPSAAAAGLQEVLSTILKNAGTFSFQERNGVPIHAFDQKVNLEGQNDYLRPCFASIGGDTVVVANNLSFLERVVDAWLGEGPRFVDLPLQRQARQRMKEAGFDAPGASDLAGGLVVVSTLREGLQGHLPKTAEQTVDANTPESKIRAEIVADLRRQGIRKSDPEIDGLVRAERLRRIEEQIDKSERSLKAMEYVKWAAFGVRHQGDRTTIRLMIELR